MGEDSAFELTVRDTDKDPSHELDHIFERFLPGSRLTGSSIGTIGLSLVYELVKMLEGEIHVNKGAQGSRLLFLCAKKISTRLRS